MKRTFLLSILLFIIALAPAKAMAAPGWVTIEGWMEEFSFHIPEGYFAYRNKDSGAINLSSYKDKVSINVSIATYLQPREHLQGLEEKYDEFDCKYDYYTSGPLTAKIFTCDGDKKYSKTIYAVFGSRYYKFVIGAGSADNVNISLFLMSLRFRRMPMFPKYGEPADKNEKIISEKGLKNDPLVEVYMDKPDNENIKITTPKSAKPYIIDADSPVYSRDLIIIRKKKKAFFQNMNKKAPATGSAKLRIHFLASGQIDKVDVISSSNFEYTQNIIDTLKDWRFVPAQIDGKDVDCTKIFEYDSFTI